MLNRKCLLLIVAQWLCWLGVSAQPATAQNVQVTGLVDYNFGTWSTGAVSLSDDVCVYKSSGGTTYYVTATGTGPAGAYRLTSGANTLAPTLRWRRIGNTYQNLTAATRRAFNNSASATVGCGGTMNASLQVNISSAALTAARPGTYSGTITILIEPS